MKTVGRLDKKHGKEYFLLNGDRLTLQFVRSIARRRQEFAKLYQKNTRLILAETIFQILAETLIKFSL